jgi:hypothetical protein
MSLPYSIEFYDHRNIQKPDKKDFFYFNVLRPNHKSIGRLTISDKEVLENIETSFIANIESEHLYFNESINSDILLFDRVFDEVAYHLAIGDYLKKVEEKKQLLKQDVLEWAWTQESRHLSHFASYLGTIYDFLWEDSHEDVEVFLDKFHEFMRVVFEID